MIEKRGHDCFFSRIILFGCVLAKSVNVFQSQIQSVVLVDSCRVVKLYGMLNIVVLYISAVCRVIHRHIESIGIHEIVVCFILCSIQHVAKRKYITRFSHLVLIVHAQVVVVVSVAGIMIVFIIRIKQIIQVVIATVTCHGICLV